MQILSGPREVIRELAFSHCGRWIAAGGQAGMRVWDTANPTAKPRRLDPERDYFTDEIAFRPDGLLFYRGERRWHLYNPETDTVTDLGIPPTLVAAPSPDGLSVVRIVEGFPLRTWEIPAKGKLVPRLNIRGKGKAVERGAFTVDRSLLATAEEHTRDNGFGEAVDSHVIVIRDGENGKMIHEWNSPFARTEQVMFSKDGSLVVVWTAGSLACWNRAKPAAKPKRAANPKQKHFTSAAIHPAGAVLTVDGNKLVRVWDLPSLASNRAISWKIGRLHAVAVSPDGTRAAVGSKSGKVLIWDWD